MLRTHLRPSIPSLDKPISRAVEKYIFSFVRHNTVFDGQFLNDIGQPDEVINVHQRPPFGPNYYLITIHANSATAPTRIESAYSPTMPVCSRRA